MILANLITAGVLALTAQRYNVNETILKNANNYATYLPQQKIQLDIFRGDYENEDYMLAFALYYHGSYTTAAENYDPINTWQLNIKANNTTIYTINNTHVGALLIDSRPLNYRGETQSLTNNNGNSYYFRSVMLQEPNAYVYEIPETLSYIMDGRSYIENGITTINITAELMTEPITKDGVEVMGSFGIAFGTLRDYNLSTNDFTFYSSFNACVYTYNNTLDATGINNYAYSVRVNEPTSYNFYTYYSDNSYLRSYFGASDTNTNIFYNHNAVSSLSYGSDISPNEQQFGANISLNDYSTFDINAGEYFYTRILQTRRVPSRMFAIHELKPQETSTQYIYTSTLYEISAQFKYTDLISGGVAVGGGAGSNGNDTTIECSGGLLANFACYINNALGDVITEGPLFKPLMRFVDNVEKFVDSTAGLFFRLLELLKRGFIL